MKINNLKIDSHNPNDISKENLKLLAESVSRDPEFMRLRPIVIDANNTIKAGNKRYEAIKNILKYKEIPDDWIVKAESISDEKLKRFMLIDNRPPGMSGQFNLEAIKLDFGDLDLKSIGFDIDFKEINLDNGLNQDDYDEDDSTDEEEERKVPDSNENKTERFFPIYANLNEKEFQSFKARKAQLNARTDKDLIMLLVEGNQC